MKIIGEELEKITHFKCLGTSTEEECCVETKITVRMGLGWRKWRKCSPGSIVRRRMFSKPIRPAMLYGADTLVTRKRQGPTSRIFTEPYLFDMIPDVMGRGMKIKGKVDKEQPPWCMLFADDIVLCSTRREHVEWKPEEWRRAREERGLKIS